VFLDTIFRLRLALIIFPSVMLIACGGGSSSSSLPDTAGPDKTPPDVVGFSPKGDDVAINSVITVTFSEPVRAVKSNNISITEYDANHQNPKLFNLPESILVLDKNQENKVLEIKLADADPTLNISLKPNKIYLVEVSGIKDIIGNDVTEICDWYFATTGAVVDPLIAEKTSCANSAAGASSNWDSLIWDKGNWK